MPRPWTGVAKAYSRSFATLCAGAVPALLDAVGRPGDLLDVGSGTGVLAAQALRRGHRVVACEPEPDLLRLSAVAAPGALVTRAALPDLPYLDGAFDAAIACFVLNHLPDPRAGLAEVARVLRPGGVLAATIWPPGPTRQGELFRAVLAASGATEPGPPAALDPDLDFDRTAPGFADLLVDQGWDEVTTTTLSWTWRPSPDDFWAAAEGGVAGLGAIWRAQTPAVRARMRVAFDDLRGDVMCGDRLDLPTTAVMGVARRLR